MKRPLVKVCGLRCREDIDFVNEAKPDLAGFILAERRKRTISPDEMRELTKHLLPTIKRVAVFLDQNMAFISELAETGLFDIIQLHGNEDEAFIKRVKDITQKSVIKAFRIENKDDIKRAESSGADFILLDSGSGGSGESFDWSLLEGIKRDFFLAGGLDPENVEDAIRMVKPYAVDVSSGVETDGHKDREKILSFVSLVRGV